MESIYLNKRCLNKHSNSLTEHTVIHLYNQKVSGSLLLSHPPRFGCELLDWRKTPGNASLSNHLHKHKNITFRATQKCVHKTNILKLI